MDCGNAVSGDWRLAARRVPGERGTSVPWLWFLRLCNWTYARVLTNQPGARESANADERRPRFTHHPNTNPERVPQCGFVLPFQGKTHCCRKAWGVAPGWHVVARWAESQCFSGLSRVRGPVWFATLPDDIRESLTSPISDPRTSFHFMAPVLGQMAWW